MFDCDYLRNACRETYCPLMWKNNNSMHMRCFCANLKLKRQDFQFKKKKCDPPLGMLISFCYSPCFQQTSLFNKKIPYRLYYLHSTADLNLFFFFPPKGISGKSQILFAIVFTTRYLDLLTSFISLYNTCMKVKNISQILVFYVDPVISVLYPQLVIVLCFLPR